MDISQPAPVEPAAKREMLSSHCVELLQLWDANCDVDGAMEHLRGLVSEAQPPDDDRVNQPAPVEPAEAPAEGEAGELADALRRLAPQNPMGTADLTLTRAAALLQQQAAELAVCREALRRVCRWGRLSGGGYSADVVMGVVTWLDAGMTGPLPAMPGYLEGRPHA